MINSTVNLACFSNTNSQYAFVPILKNAHNWGVDLFKEHCNFDRSKPCQADKKFIIFLRDPYTRWISAATQWISFRIVKNQRRYYNIDRHLLELMGITVDFDGHTTPQSAYTKQLSENNCDITYFNLDDSKFEVNIKHFVKLRLGVTIPEKHIPKSHATTDDPFKIKVTKQIINFLETQPKLVENIKEYYKEDYKLIETCKFYRYNDSL